ncbi:pyridoxal-phosphate-dependent aminotransferase family protein [Marinimicrococcus flavescens]|uniref:Aminotransferase class V-fold PLP-dependent enzyme n=1 Tax=Marinimicrococcus flavescens TaxID=3031815 RepID=A0AAP3V0Y0_9PROT|nr:aminotransferase class V-fold PLP-dependent enzyme [Marinimicrococcus flavescens]
MLQRGRSFIQLPGPTNIPDRVLAAMHRPVVDFAGREFTRMTRGCLEDLKQVFQTRGEVFPYVALGHGMWEVVLDNLLALGDAVLVPDTGRFSASWCEMIRAQGIELVTTSPFYRESVDPAAVEEALRADRGHRIKAVLMVQVETSTGVLHDVAAVRRAIDAAGHPALLVVDAVASLATVDLPMDAWGVDAAITASQKGLMMPPGMGFVAVGPRARQAALANTAPRKYWDWGSRRGEESYMWFYGTPPLQMIWGLRAALDMLLEEGMPAVFARHARLAEAARRAVAHWSEAGALEFQALAPAARSNAVTAVRFTQGDPEAVRLHCRDELQVAFGGGLGPFQGHILRIGHMGDLNEPMLLGALAVLETGLRRLDVPHRPGGVTAAVEWLATQR